MRLNRAQIANFRSIKSVTINFDTRCRVLVGINESGKSNLLTALALLDPKRTINPGDLRDFPDEEDPSQDAFVRFIFTLDKDERIANYEKAASEVMWDNPNVPILISGGKKLTLAQFFDTRTEALHVVDVRTKSRRTTAWRLSEHLKLAGSWKKPSPSCPANQQVITADGKTALLKNFKLLQAHLAQNLPDGCLVDADPEDVNSLAIVHISSLVSSDLPGCLYWTYSESNLLPGQISLDAFAANPNMCEPLKHMFALADIDDISTDLTAAKTRPNGVRNLLNRVASRATKHMKSVWKEYRGINIELSPNGSNIDASIKDEHNLYDFSRRSDGFKRFITFLLMVSAKERTKDLVNTLYLHDEPDVSLHPSGARYLRDELIKIADNNYVVYSTHSIFMIDREHLSRHLIVEKKSEITNVREVDESNIVDEEVVYNALGYSIFENLKKHNLIFEGWRDKRLCQVALRSVPSKHKGLKSAYEDLGMCHARGVKDIGRITPMLELAGRNWLVISDGDKPAIEQQRLYSGEGPWFRYDELFTSTVVLTGEDFLKASAYKPYLEAISSEHSNLPVLPFENLDGEEPKLEVIRRWLRQGGIIGDSAKPIIEKLKEQLFSALKPNHIDEKYYDFLAALASKLSSN